MKYETVPCVEEDEDLIEEKLDAINDSIVHPEEDTEDKYLVFKITDADGNIIAGCLVYISNWKMANLDVLWVDEKHRGKGLGSALIRAAEKAARESACHTMILGTFSFQARPLYEKHGYTLCGTVRDFPRGHANYTLLKRLDQPGQEYAPSRDLSGEFEIKDGNEEDAEFISTRLGEYNSSQATRAGQYTPLNKKLLDGDGNLIAAIFAGVGTWNQFEVDMIWVDEPYRGQGIGSELLAGAEREARELGGYFALAWGVFDWQSGFFRKNGYTAAGTLEDCPTGHFMYVLEKRF
ncbi:MAG: GNAT family N-acetyltransferase [Lachnospiraceae bacterium]|nr:GNAT family N-acetyltransferase [Lachnospiraceae bacterium]